MKQQSDKLWSIEVKFMTQGGYPEKVSLWILSDTMKSAVTKAERFGKKQGYRNPRITKVDDKGTIDVF